MNRSTKEHLTVGDVGEMFSRLTRRYRVFNRLSSLGLDHRWRRVLVSTVTGAECCLDLGTGTGDVALELLSAEGSRRVFAVDVSLEMLTAASCYGGGKEIHWAQASGDRLPFKEGSFDAVVSAYVLRNLWRAGVAENSLIECARILKKNGKLVFLDLTRPSHRLVRAGHAVYNRTILPIVGKFVFGRDWPGDYLAESIRTFPTMEIWRSIFLKAGFSRFESIPLLGGVVSLFVGYK